MRSSTDQIAGMRQQRYYMFRFYNGIHELGECVVPDRQGFLLQNTIDFANKINGLQHQNRAKSFLILSGMSKTISGTNNVNNFNWVTQDIKNGHILTALEIIQIIMKDIKDE